MLVQRRSLDCHLPRKSQDLRVDPFACVMTLHPGGPMGVASKLYGPLKCSQAEMSGCSSDWRRRLTVISACRRRRSHLFRGKAGSTLARMARKCALNVRIARSALLRRCMSGGTFWCVHFHTSVMVSMYAALASLSRTCASTGMLNQYEHVLWRENLAGRVVRQ